MIPYLIATGGGIDPGTTYHAWTLLEAYSDGMIWPRQMVYAPYDRNTWRGLFYGLRARDGVAQGTVALETIMGGLYGDSAARRARFKQVSETKGSERLFRQLCEETGVPFVDRAASHGRKVLIGSGSASDPQIRLAIEGIYTTKVSGDDLPWHGPATDRPHVYDAMVVGMVELYERMAGVDDKGAPTAAGPLVEPKLAARIRSLLHCPGGFLPRRVAAEVAILRGKEKGDRDEDRIREQMGLPPKDKKERRKPSRATAEAGKAKAALTRLKNKIRRM